MPLASSPKRGPASQPAVTGPMEVFETSAGLPSWPVATQPPPEEPPVIEQPMRYIVGSSWARERRPGLSWHWNIFWPSYGAAAGKPVAVMPEILGTAGALNSTGRAE